MGKLRVLGDRFTSIIYSLFDGLKFNRTRSLTVQFESQNIPHSYPQMSYCSLSERSPLLPPTIGLFQVYVSSIVSYEHMATSSNPFFKKTIPCDMVYRTK